MCPTPFTPLASLVCSCSAYPCRGAYRVSLVPDDPLFACHARLPRRPLGTSPRPFGTVPQVLSSDDVERLLASIFICGFRGCVRLQESRLPVACKVPCLHFMRFVLPPAAGRSSQEERPRIGYLHASKTRYWWMVSPFQIKTFLDILVKEHFIRDRQADQDDPTFQACRSCQR
jgi:hypothetical protein